MICIQLTDEDFKNSWKLILPIVKEALEDQMEKNKTTDMKHYIDKEDYFIDRYQDNDYFAWETGVYDLIVRNSLYRKYNLPENANVYFQDQNGCDIFIMLISLSIIVEYMQENHVDIIHRDLFEIYK